MQPLMLLNSAFIAPELPHARSFRPFACCRAIKRFSDGVSGLQIRNFARQSFRPLRRDAESVLQKFDRARV